jgi:hypothetical protein
MRRLRRRNPAGGRLYPEAEIRDAVIYVMLQSAATVGSLPPTLAPALNAVSARMGVAADDSQDVIRQKMEHFWKSNTPSRALLDELLDFARELDTPRASASHRALLGLENPRGPQPSAAGNRPSVSGGVLAQIYLRLSDDE